MLEIAEYRDERAELQALLDSGIFHRAPHLHSFLKYVCERYFQGEADQIKEYTIGVEALRRAPDFDPKRDSIVRVEAHRLRKRLDEYYLREGASRRIQIVIPNGQYIPHFLFRNAPAHTDVPSQVVTAAPLDLLPGSEGSAPEIAEMDEGLAPSGTKYALWISLAPLALCIAGLTFLALRQHVKVPPRQEEFWSGSAAQPVPAEYRMLAGYYGPAFTDRQGHVWNADAYFKGGFSTAVPGDHRIEGQPDDELIKSQRSGQFQYDIPLAMGTYELHLYFAESDYGPGNALGGGETSRLFDAWINGKQVLQRFDPLAESGGPNRLLVRVFKDISPGADGKLHLAFRPFAAPGRVAPSPAFLNGLEILQGIPGRVHCVRIVTQDHPITDVDGHIWSSDEYFFGGMLASRDDSVVSARDKTLYRGERYGNFSYHIPLAPGKYRLTLHFAETWFGTPESKQSGSETRRFSVIANGIPLLQNFEIAKEAGLDHEITKVFGNLQPNERGALWLEFVPLENYAEVNAIEVEQTE